MRTSHPVGHTAMCNCCSRHQDRPKSFLIDSWDGRTTTVEPSWKYTGQVVVKQGGQQVILTAAAAKRLSDYAIDASHGVWYDREEVPGSRYWDDGHAKKVSPKQP